eukprot:CAMPEP_0197826596 /NCGR_PEP_ID=MMETSP1437-20131217/3540_1 /TAXON_ID=49252 ORGANISM="Eucampia antarctica, Strain CCMP1452" /NCGR_SAMPLE_ID=MMETSP1437 /ASSEMBLY_ACC=CAM_ASM_001096 /LENGTH=170 /DNA_ID=CAMNT_0043427101 /DNA_START=67 /DNA_END=575 /DNA_ORIENTATION=-
MKRRKEEAPDDNDSDGDDMDMDMLENVSFPLSDLLEETDETPTTSENNSTLPTVPISMEENGWDDKLILKCFDQCLNSYGDEHDNLEDKYKFSPLLQQTIPKSNEENTDILDSSKVVVQSPISEEEKISDDDIPLCNEDTKQSRLKPDMVPLPEWAVDPTFASIKLGCMG